MTLRTLPVAGITQVTAGCASTNFRNTCAQLCAPNSAAQGGSGLPATFSKRPSVLEGAVDDDGHALVRAQRQQLLFRLARRCRVVELHEIGFLALDERDQIGIGAGGVVRHAQVLDAALRLPAAQRAQMGVHVHQVVNLHELDAIVFEQGHRALHLLDALLLGRAP